jgi:predicted ATPase/DNA-binding CsgD family transcriptional regulator
MALVLAETIGFTLYADQSPESQVFQYLHDRSMLLLMDNLEHLVEGADFINRLLRAAPQIQILATSRERLNLLAETAFTVDGFHVDDWPTPQAALDADAVRLFLQSARRAQASFSLTDADLPGISRICRITGGMPLAIELAAAWVDVLSIDEIAPEIERNYQFLSAQYRDMPARHRSLRATFDSSVERLLPQEHDVLRKLSVFQGCFSRDAAQEVAGASVSALQSLVSKSLLKHRGASRYEVHELLRQYLDERLSQSGSTDAIQTAWRDYYLNRLHWCAPRLKGGGQLQALNDIEAEFDNVRAAWMLACAQREPLLGQALESMFLFAMMRNRYQDGDILLHHAAVALADYDSAAIQGERMRAALYRFWLLRWREGTIARYPEVLAQIKAFLPPLQELGVAYDIALYRLILGALSSEFEVEREHAEDLLRESLTHFEALHDGYYAAWGLHFLAVYSLTARGLAPAIDLQTQSLELRRACGDLSGEVYALYNLSSYWMQMGDLETSLTLAHRMRTLSQEIGERSGELMSGTLLALVAALQGELTGTDDLAQRAQHLAAELNHPLGERVSAAIQGFAAVLRGQNSAGLERLERIQRDVLPPSMVYFTNLALAMARINDRNVDVTAYLKNAARYALAVQGTGLIAWCLCLFSVRAATEGETAQAVRLLPSVASSCPALEDWPPLRAVRALAEQEADRQRGGPYLSAAELLNQAAFGDEARRFPPRVLVSNQALVEPLSERELEILMLIGQGLQNGDIADRLVIGISTVKKHISHIYGKLGVTTRDQAVLRARELGLP